MIAGLEGAVQPYVEAYGKSWRKADEEWQRDHQKVQVLWLWEDALELGNSVFRLLQRRVEEWRKAVAQGAVAYDDRSNDAFQEAFRALLEPEGMARQSIMALAQAFGAVKGADEFHAHCEKVRRTLNDSAPPVLSGARGLHIWDLDEEEVEQFEHILQSGEARPRANRIRRRSRPWPTLPISVRVRNSPMEATHRSGAPGCCSRSVAEGQQPRQSGHSRGPPCTCSTATTQSKSGHPASPTVKRSRTGRPAA